MKPRLSILLCTYNGESLLRACLDSILSQDFPHVEVLCIDGQSQDRTPDLIREYAAKDSRVRLVPNPNRLPEGRGNGKWLGAELAQGEILVVIDQDNVLQRTDLFATATTLLEQDEKLLGVLGGLRNDRSDTIVVRYVSLFGTDSFFAYRSVDFLRSLGEGVRNCGTLGERLTMTTDNMPLSGGNCFFYRRSDVLAAGGYDQDVLLVKRLILAGKPELAIIGNATKHYAESSLTRLALKKFFWARRFFESAEERFNYWPTTARERVAFGRNLLFNLLLFPNAYYSWRVFVRSGDWVAWLFPVFAFLNTVAYAVNCICQWAQRAGPSNRPAN